MAKNKKDKKKDKNANQSAKPAAIPMNEPAPAPNAAAAGQEAFQATATPSTAGIPTLDQAMRTQNEAIAEQAEIGSQQYNVQEVLGKLLEAKKNTTPYVKQIARTQRKLGESKTFSEYIKEGMTMDQAIELTNAQVSRAQSRVSFLNMKREEEEQNVADTIQAVTDHLNSQLAALGLQIDASQIQKQDALTMMQLSGGGGGGGGGGGSRGGGSGSASIGGFDMEAFEKDAAALREAVGNTSYGVPAPEKDWPTAYNELAGAYPEMSSDDINQILGGSWDPNTGVNEGLATVTPDVYNNYRQGLVNGEGGQ